MAIHNYNLKRRKNKFKKTDIPDYNKKPILDFIEDQASQGNSPARQVKYLGILKQIAEDIDFKLKKASKKDIKKLCSQIHNSDKSDWTKHDYLLTIKVFYKYLNGGSEYPDKVKWIKPVSVKNNKTLPRDLLTIEDAKKMANHTNNLRDRCFILMLYETGARIGEILQVKIRDVEFDKYGAKITLPNEGKTGARKIRVIACPPSISNWLQQHPRKKDRKAPLFCGIWSKNKGKQWGYRSAYNVLKETAKEAEVDKPVNPHHFRHSRATELAQKLTEAQLCEYMGWVIGSKEAATYVHLSGRDTDKAILEMYGLKEEEKKESELKPIECPRCGSKNDPGADFCNQCSLGLDEKTIMEYDKKKEQGAELLDLVDNQSIQELVHQEVKKQISGKKLHKLIKKEVKEDL